VNESSIYVYVRLSFFLVRVVVIAVIVFLVVATMVLVVVIMIFVSSFMVVMVVSMTMIVPSRLNTPTKVIMSISSVQNFHLYEIEAEAHHSNAKHSLSIYWFRIDASSHCLV